MTAQEFAEVVNSLRAARNEYAVDDRFAPDDDHHDRFGNDTEDHHSFDHTEAVFPY